MKVLWIGDAVVQSGFSMVTHNICNELVNKTDLVVYGVRYDGRERNPCNYHIYPAQTLGDLYSFQFAVSVIRAEKPDVVVIFNDLAIVSQYLQTIRKVLAGSEIAARFVPLFPVNYLPLDRDDILDFTRDEVSHVMTYTEFSKKKIREINPHLDITAISHGVDKKNFFPVPDAKQQFGYKNYFIVGSINSNTYRKRLDLFLEGFAKFAKGKADVKCLIHANNKDISYELDTLAKDMGIVDKLILSTGELPFDQLNILHNLIDVNTNTSMGEGFGLSLVEGAACGTPIVCPAHGNLKDIWGNNADYIKTERSEYVAGTTFRGDVISTSDFAAKLERLYEDRVYLKERREQILHASEDPRFNWSVIADNVFNVLSNANKGRFSVVG